MDRREVAVISVAILTLCQDMISVASGDLWLASLSGHQGAAMKLKAALLLAMAVAGTTGCDRVPGTPENRARTALSGVLIDPGSAQINLLPSDGSGTCGTVNAKNRMGGYVGARPFLIESEYASPIIFEEPSISDYRLWAAGPESGSGRAAYDRLDYGCSFRERWAKSCDSGSAAAIPVDEKLCALWRAENWSALRDLAGY